MPIVDIDRASQLDKIHTKRMQHAFAQLCVQLIALEDDRVNRILQHKNITVWPGPVVGILYRPGDRQVLDAELKAANEELEHMAKLDAKKKKAKK